MSISVVWKNPAHVGTERNRQERGLRQTLDEFFKSRGFSFRGELTATVAFVERNGSKERTIKVLPGTQPTGSESDGFALSISTGQESRTLICRVKGDIKDDVWRELLAGTWKAPASAAPEASSPSAVGTVLKANGHSPAATAVMSAQRALEILVEAKGSHDLLAAAEAEVREADQKEQALVSETTRLHQLLEQKLQDLERARLALMEAKDQLASLKPNEASLADIKRAKEVLEKLTGSV